MIPNLTKMHINQVRVECILPYSKGFICGGSGGTLIFYDKR